MRSRTAGPGWIFVAMALLAACGGGSSTPERRIPFDAAADFRERQRVAQEHVIDSGSTGSREQMVLVHRGLRNFSEDTFDGELSRINERRDLADFSMSIVLRALYQLGDEPQMSAALRAKLEDAVLNFKYWIDEPGIDGMVYWSENHHILFHTDELLAGQLLPDRVFTNSGMTGREHYQKGKELFLRWAELRSDMGFTEFHSTNYYEEDIGPLVNLVDFAEDPDVATTAAMLADILLFDIALNSHDGMFAGTHGRTFERVMVGAESSPTHATANLVFDQGRFNRNGGISFTPLMLTQHYVPPAAVILAGRPEAQPEVWTSRQRMSIDVEEAADFGLSTDPQDLASTTFWWSAGAYGLPETIEASFETANRFGQLQEGFFSILAPLAPLWRLGVADDVVRDSEILTALVRGIHLSRVNTVSHHKPAAMLGSLQDTYAGEPSAQNHAWTATLDADTTVFTSHPVRMEDGRADWFGYFAGGASMPRIAQVEDVAVILYNPIVRLLEAIFEEARYTHAYFPFQLFDEWRSAEGWHFARKGDGYVALYSRNGTRVPEDGRFAGRELIADDPVNAWLCEIGWAGEDGSFDDFVSRILSQPLSVGDGLQVTYGSDQGQIEFGWTGPLRVNGDIVPLDEFPRMDNPFAQVPWRDRRYEISAGGHRAVLDFDRLERFTDS